MNAPQQPSGKPSRFSTFNPTNLPKGSSQMEGLTGSTPVTQSQYDPQFQPLGIDLNEVRAQRQTFLDKAGNGVAKAAGNTVGVFGAAAGLLYGSTVGGFTNAGEDELWSPVKGVLQNNITEKVAEANQWMEEKFPHYRTEREQNATALSPDNWLSANFLFDGIVKNFGFSFGAGAATKLGVKGVSKLLSPFVMRGAAGLAELEAVAQTVGTGEKLLSHLQKTATLAKGATAIENAAGSFLAAGSEAALEGRQTYDNLLQTQLQAFQQTQGREPLPHELRDIQARALEAGKADFYANAAILTFSNLGQHTSGLAGQYKQALKRTAPSALQTWGKRASLVFNPSESLEEGAQTFASTVSQDYYARKKDLNGQASVEDLVLAAFKGLNTMTNTKEGLESFLMGGVAGGLSSVALGGASQAWKGVQQEYEQGQQLLRRIQEKKEQDPVFATRVEAAARQASLGDDMRAAVEAGDVYQYQNLRHDSLKSQVQLHQQLGTTKEFLQELDQLKALDDEQFAEALGLDVDAFEQQTAAQYVDKLKAEVKRLGRTWQSIETSYPKADAEIKERLFDSLTNIQNRDQREKELEAKLILGTGLSYQALQVLNPDLTGEEYVAQVTDKLTQNPTPDATVQDALDFLKLKNERLQLVQNYQDLLAGKPTTRNAEETRRNIAASPDLRVSGEPDIASSILDNANPELVSGALAASTPEERLEQASNDVPAQAPAPAAQAAGPQPAADNAVPVRSAAPKKQPLVLSDEDADAMSAPVEEPVVKPASASTPAASTNPELEGRLRQLRATEESYQGDPNTTDEQWQQLYQQIDEVETQLAADTPTGTPEPESAVAIPEQVPAEQRQKFATVVDWERYRGSDQADNKKKVTAFKQRLQQQPQSASVLSYYVQHQNIGGQDRYNVYAEGPNGSINLGFLEQTDGRNVKAEIVNDPVYAEGVALNRKIKALAEKNSGQRVPVSVSLNMGIDNLPPRQEGISLAQAGPQYFQGNKLVIFQQSFKQGRRQVERLLSGQGKELVAYQDGMPSDGYFLQVVTDRGTRYIGLRTSALAADELATVAAEVAGIQSTDEQAKELNNQLFLAAEPKQVNGQTVRRHAKFASVNYQLVMQVSTSAPNANGYYVDVPETIIPVDLGNLQALAGNPLLTPQPFRRQVNPMQWSPSDFTTTTQPNLWTSPKFVLTDVAEATLPVAVVEAADVPLTGAQTAAVTFTDEGWGEDLNAEAEALNQPETPSFKTQWNADLVAINFAAARQDLAKLLPSWMSLDNLENLAGGLYNNGYTWGAFTENVVYLASQAPQGTEFHEAFHAVWRVLLSDSERAAVTEHLRSTKPALFSLKNIAAWASQYPAYQSLNLEELRALRLEEWMADEFQQFMLGKKKQGLIGRVLSKLREFVNWLRGNKDVLHSLFSSIEQGAFQSAQPINQAQGIAYKLAGATQAESATIISTVALQFVNDFDKYQGSAGERLQQMIAELKAAKQVVPPATLNTREEKLLFMSTRNLYVENGKLYPVAFKDTAEIGKEVIARLKKSGFQVDAKGMYLVLSAAEQEALTNDKPLPEEQVLDEDAEATDPDAGPDVSFDKNGFSLTGFDSLGKQIKQFLSLLGHKPDGAQFYVPANTLGTYGQLLRILHGKDTLDEMKTEIARYADSNPIFNDLQNKLISKEQDDYFGQKFFNAFSVEFIPARHVQYTAEVERFVETPEGGQFQKFPAGISNSYMANRNNDGGQQLSKYITKFYEQQRNGQNFKQVEQELLGRDNRDTGLLESYFTNQGADLYQVQAALDKLGLDFSAAFLKAVKERSLTVLDLKTGKDKQESLSPSKFVAAIRRVVAAYQAENPFAANNSQDEEQVYIKSTLRRLGEQDAKFRSDILQTSFKNAEGENQYSFTAPSFETRAARHLQQGKHQLDLDSPFYQKNWLVKHGRVREGNKLLIPLETTAGLRETTSGEGMTYAKMDSKTRIIYDHALMNQGIFLWAQHEAKSTAYLINFQNEQGKSKLPTFAAEGKLSANALSALRDFAAQEEEKIARTMEELYGSNPKDSSLLVDNYHFLPKANEKLGLPGGYGPDDKPNVFPKELVEKLLAEGKQNLLPNGLKHITLPSLNGTDLSSKDTEKLDNHFQELFKSMLEEYERVLSEKGLGGMQGMSLLAGADWATKLPFGSGDQGMRNYKLNILASSTIVQESYAQLLRGQDYASFHKDAVDVTKRGGGLIAAGRSLGEGNFIAALIADEEGRMVDSSGKKKSYDATDAQSYMSSSRWLFYMKRIGKLNAQTEVLANKLVRGEELLPREFKEATELITANPVKGVYFDGATYIKTSYLPLLPELTSTRESGFTQAIPGREKLHNLRMLMQEQGLDEVHRKTASKLQRKGLNKLNADNTYTGKLNTIQLNNADWRLQVENPSGKTKITQGTQLMQLIDAGMPGDHILEMNGVEMPLSEVRKEYQRVMALNKDQAYSKAESLLKANLDGTSVFANSVQHILEGSGANQLMLDFFAQENGKFKYSTDLPHVQQKFQELFFSYFNKQVFGQKVPGMKTTLVESTGFRVWDEQLQDYRPLRIHQLEGGKIALAEVILSEELLVKKGLTRQQFEQLPQEQQDRIVTMLGFRIPTQAHHSMIPFKVVDWVPAYYGSVSIVPSEVVHLAGSDYDVDSLFVERTEWDVNEDGSIHFYDEQTETDADYRDYLVSKDPEVSRLVAEYVSMHPELSQEVAQEQALDKLRVPQQGKTPYALSNTRLQAELAFLRNPQNAEALHRPASMQQLTSMKSWVNQQRGMEENSQFPYASWLVRNQHTAANLAGKQNVGPAANVSKTSAMLTKNAVTLTTPFEIFDRTITGWDSFVEQDSVLRDGEFVLDDNGSPVQQKQPKDDSISTLVSGMTDDAKERFSFSLNLTQKQVGIAGLGTSLGMGFKNMLLLVNQPAIRQLSTLQEQMDTAIVPQKGNPSALTGKYIQELQEKYGLDETGFPSLKELVASVKDAKSLEAKLRENTLTKEEARQQVQALRLYAKLEELTKEFNAVNTLLNTNKGVAISLQDQQKLVKAGQTLTGSETSPSEIGLAWLETEQNIATNKWLVESKLLPLSEQVFLLNTSPITKLGKQLQAAGLKDKDVPGMQEQLLSMLTMRSFDQLLFQGTGKHLQDYLYLLTDPEQNIVSKFSAVKQLPGLKDHLLLKNLSVGMPAEGKDPYYRLEYNSFTKQDPEQVQAISESWYDLEQYKNEDPQVQQQVRDFARELRIYLALKHNMEYRSGSFISLLPASVFGPISDKLKKVKTTFRSDEKAFPASFVQQFGQDWEAFQASFLLSFYRNPEVAKANRPDKADIVKAEQKGNEQHVTFAEGKTPPLVFQGNKGIYVRVARNGQMGVYQQPAGHNPYLGVYSLPAGLNVSQWQQAFAQSGIVEQASAQTLPEEALGMLAPDDVVILPRVGQNQEAPVIFAPSLASLHSAANEQDLNC